MTEANQPDSTPENAPATSPRDQTTPSDPTNQNAPETNAAAMPPALRTPANTAAEQPVAHDRAHEQNEVAGASRGEFGRQSDQGATQGGYGDEVSRGLDTYAGPPVQAPATTGYVGERAQTDVGFPATGNGSFGTVAVGAGFNPESAVGRAFGNDNDAPLSTGSGYADTYGTSSLGGLPNSGAQPERNQRNQQEDYTPGHPADGPAGQRTGQAPTNAGYGHDEAGAVPPTTADRNGYQAAGSANSEGSTREGFGSKGGSYNDEYDSSEPDSRDSSPAKGDQTQQETAKNYGKTSDERTNDPDSPDYGAAPGPPDPTGKGS